MATWDEATNRTCDTCGSHLVNRIIFANGGGGSKLVCPECERRRKEAQEASARYEAERHRQRIDACFHEWKVVSYGGGCCYRCNKCGSFKSLY